MRGQVMHLDQINGIKLPEREKIIYVTFLTETILH